MKRRRIIRGGLMAAAIVLVGLVVFDHVGLAGYAGSDWRRFDRQAFSVVAIDQPDEIVIRAGSTDTPVRLVGVDAPDAGAHGYEQSLEYTNARLKSGSVTLKLEPTQTRDDNGRLLAYVYLADNDALNLALIRDGKAYADRRAKHTFAGQYEQAEAEARKKSRGIWAGLTEDQMPAWRREWLERMRRERAAATQPR